MEVEAVDNKERSRVEHNLTLTDTTDIHYSSLASDAHCEVQRNENKSRN